MLFLRILGGLFSLFLLTTLLWIKKHICDGPAYTPDQKFIHFQIRAERINIDPSLDLHTLADFALLYIFPLSTCQSETEPAPKIKDGYDAKSTLRME